MMRLAALAAATGWVFETAAAQPAARSAVPPQHPPARRQPTVIIDPGHGGVDPGAVGRSGVYEKDIVLLAALQFAHQLAATRRYRVVLTRSTDELIDSRPPFLSSKLSSELLNSSKPADWFASSVSSSGNSCAGFSAAESLRGGVEIAGRASEGAASGFRSFATG